MLPAFGIGVEQEREFHAAGVPFKERGRRTDEALAIMRRCWSEDEVTFEGEFWRLDKITVLPKPLQQPMPAWIGGNSEAAMRRAGRLGTVGSVLHPARPLRRRRRPDAAVRGRGGARGSRRSLRHARELLLRARPRRRARDGGPLHSAQPRGRRDARAVHGLRAPALLRERLEEYAAGGGSKFIARPMCPPDRMLDQLRQLAEDVVPGFHRR